MTLVDPNDLRYDSRKKKPKLSITFSHTLDIDFNKLPIEMQNDYNAAKEIYDNTKDKEQLETFYEELREYINDGEYENFDVLELANSLDQEISDKGII